jgi:acyl carrier protein
MKRKSQVDSREYSYEAILQDLVVILEDITSDWDMDVGGPMGQDTKLIADLAFESIDVVQFIVAIEEHYKRRGLPYEEFLMLDGRYVDEIKVADVAAFLARHLKDS